jgi:hypothetical protein
MCYKIGAPAAATIVLGSTAFLYTTGRVGLHGALELVLAGEVVVAVVMVMWMILSMRAAHAPENILEHEHTHPLHRHSHTHGLLVQEYAAPQPAPEPESGPSWPAVGYRSWGQS